MNIYVLQDPCTHEIRYVGRTLYSVETRRKKHVSEAKGSPRFFHRYVWIRSLLKHGLEPYATLVQVVPDDDWAKAEIYWIAYFREQGCDLTNSCDGGLGVTNMSAESRARIGAANKGRKPAWTVESRAKLSASLKGVPSPLRGKPLSDEHRRKISEGQLGRESPNKGVTQKPEWNEKRSRSHSGKPSPLRGSLWSPERRAAQPKTYKKRGSTT